MIIRQGKIDDLKYIDWLRSKESYSVGFLPKQAYVDVLTNYGRRKGYLYSDILVIIEEKQPVGFCYVSYHGINTRIFQIAIQDDARRFYRASKLIEEIEKRSSDKNGIIARVAIDLESNLFWKALNFEIIGFTTGTLLNHRAKKGRDLAIYYKAIKQALLLDINPIVMPIMGKLSKPIQVRL